MDYPFYLKHLQNLPPDLVEETAQVAMAEQGWIVHNYFIRTELRTLPREAQTQRLKDLVGKIVQHLDYWLPASTYSGHAMNQLEGGKRIAEHTDINTFGSTVPMNYVLFHKIHVPLVTNPQVISEHRRSYHMPQHEQHMHKGGAYLYNDYAWHGARNDGSEARIHLLLKYKDPEWKHRLALMKKLGISEYNTYEE